MSSDSKKRLKLWLRLLKATHMIETDVRERFRVDYGTTLPRFDVMAALDRFPDGLRMSQLSGVLRVSNGNMTGIVDRLEAEGMVERRRVAGDRRAMLVGLTTEGKQHFKLLAASHEQWVDQMLQAVSGRDADRILTDLSMMIDSLEKEDIT